MLAINQVLQEGRYRIIDQFEQEGSEVVYQAYDTVRGVNVVLQETLIKLPKVTTASQQENLKLAFANQVKSLKEIKHDSFLHVHDYFSEIDRQYVVIESVEGRDLDELLRQNDKPFKIADVLNWADQLLDALGYLHAQKPPIIHAEVSPKNIKLTSDGKVKLVTAGLSKTSTEKSASAAKSGNADALHFSALELIWDDLDSASQKFILKTFDERSEEILKQPADARSDIYAFGATIYQLLTNRPPIDALERSIDLLDGKQDPLEAPSRINPDIPIEISDVVMRSMEIKRENRFDSAGILRHMLRAADNRLKERLAAEKKKEQEARFALEQKVLEAEMLLREQELLEIELEPDFLAEAVAADEKQQSEDERQLSAIREQLREAEAQRQLAERRAADAEKRLVEKEIHESAIPQRPPVVDPPKPVVTAPVETKPAVTAPVIKAVPVPVVTPAPAAEVIALDDEDVWTEIAPDVKPVSPAASTQYQSTVPSMFDEPQKKGGMWKVALPMVAVLALAGGGFGVWRTMSSNQSNASPKTVNQALTSNDSDVPKTENEPKPEAQPVADTASSETTNTTAPGTTQEPANPELNSTDPKNKNLQQGPKQQPAKKPVVATAKPTPNAKKVTVDDIINDN